MASSHNNQDINGIDVTLLFLFVLFVIFYKFVIFCNKFIDHGQVKEQVNCLIYASLIFYFFSF